MAAIIFSDVQKAVSELLPPDAILVGHSLNSDLTAMKVSFFLWWHSEEARHGLHYTATALPYAHYKTKVHDSLLSTHAHVGG